ncbi:MAG: septum formation initiator family protein [Deltaproteobacteria bacterium]|nr:septum formation initiator family protein [Deltaproteobacteria bacterium]
MNLNRTKFFKSSFVALLLLGLIITWLGFGKRGFLHLYKMEKNRQACIERIRKVEKENQALIEEIQRLNTDTAYLESVARKELGLVKDGEILFKFSRGKDDRHSFQIERE